MKQTVILRKIRQAATARGIAYETKELGDHTGVILNATRVTVVSRGTHLDDDYAEQVYRQCAGILGNRWWK